jgi:beta-glucanase (GH16 family)
MAAATGLVLVSSLAFSGSAAAGTVVPSALPAVPTFGEEFTSLNSAYWSGRGLDQVISPRKCGLPVAANSKISGGKFTATVAKATTKQKNQIIASQKKVFGKKYSCKYGYFTNASLSTDGRFTIRNYGKVETRVKFPVSQGMHFGVWLQSAGGPEIDVVEGFGYGKGITNYVHVKNGATSKRYPDPKKNHYVLTSKTKKKSWWSSYHTFSVEWTPTATAGVAHYVFKGDGVVTWEANLPTPASADYFLVMSSTSSDWELKYLKKPTKGKLKGVKKAKVPSRMYVDYVRVWQAS